METIRMTAAGAFFALVGFSPWLADVIEAGVKAMRRRAARGYFSL